ncbi:uncharacterized protein C8Q71DRAFT_858327 [Rhodofomes roseus]|uniref:LIM zinc-binding domain-containing protein n=1 Tax=Rhodofomes roseus TaxID=34475 RepID=A0ABQ8KF48_9APHY|nr:uncharacterized protein C8Q71DRAFT_858327 [Rhodofomes roseus]KAH9836337.1 hypothetical protein C8Q71DRAFT_858327 [Rhodofomes roseus]
MAQNVYTYPQPGMAAQYDPRTQPYPYQAYPRQQQPQQQVYNQANAATAYPYAPSTYQAHVHAGMAAPATRSPLPAPPQPIAYGHPPQPQYTARPAYSPQSTYAPSSFDQRATLPQRTTPSPGPTRRPLPDPGHTARSNSVSAHPSPQPPPSPGPRAPSHRSALSVSSIPTPPARPTSPRVPQPKTTTAVSPPRPLPQPALPRSIGQSNLARSPSPTKRAFAEAQIALPQPDVQASQSIPAPAPRRGIVESVPPHAIPPGQKFVPHWKRALPTPGQQGQVERRSTVSGPGPTPPPTVRPLPQSPGNHARSQSGYPLPQSFAGQTNSPPRKLPQPNGRPLVRSPSPTPAGRQGSPESSDDDDIAGSALLSRPQDWPGHSSPQYGTRDLPGQIRSSTSRDSAASQRSATSRLAELSLYDSRDDSDAGSRSPSRHGHSQSVPIVPTQQAAPPIARRWPAGLPPLPRAPAALESLDDAPPPSLRRSPSPSRPPTSPLRGARRPSIRTNELTRPRPAPSPSAPRTPYESPASATPPLSGMSDSSVFTLSSFPRPPSFAPPHPPIVSPTPAAASSSPARPRSADSSRSVFTLSAFPQPPPVVVQPPPRKDSLSRTQNNRTPVPAVNGTFGRDTSRTGARQPIPKVSFPANADSDSGSDSEGAAPGVPAISISVSGSSDDDVGGPVINILGADDDTPSVPSISIAGADEDSSVPQISVGGSSGGHKKANTRSPLERVIRKGPGLTCGGCGGAIVGRTVYAMGAKWHPGCFRCCVCNELLENLSSYEHEGRAYCNLDYHELFAPKCYHCKTSIIDERFITLDDPELGKRTYHEQHFFCAECGDPFMDPKGASFRSSGGGQTFSGDGEFSGGDGDVRFTVYGGHPYCENCHVRLRYPKCKKCKKPIRDGMRAVEALGGKYCWECFTCAGCDQPFENPSFFQRDGKPFCERCFSIIIKNEM